MKYSLFRWVQGETTSVDLSEVEFTRGVFATRALLEALSVEEKFNLVLGNFEEYERDLLGDALHRTLFSRDDWSDHMSHLHHLNRRVVNLLSTCRLYIDQVRHNLSGLYGSDSPQLNGFTARCSREYDENLGFRAMEALRNYVQHRNLPAYAIHHDSRKIVVESEHIFEHCVSLMLSTDVLRDDGGFKAQVLAELEALGDRVDITPLMRNYVAGLGRVHYAVRDTLTSDLVSWEAELDNLRRKFIDAGGKDTDHLTLARETDDGIRDQLNHFFPEPVQRRRWLENKNRNLTHIERARIVSARVVEQPGT